MDSTLSRPVAGRPDSDAGRDQSRRELSSQPGGGLGSQVASGMLWTTAQKWVTRLAGLGTLAILTRLISPDEFGVVAAAMATIPFVYLMSDAFSTFLVQSERVDQELLDTSFWFSLAASLMLMGTAMLAAPFVSALTGISELTPVLRLLSFSLLLSGLAAVPTAILRRRMAFRSLAMRDTAAAVIAQFVAVGLALSDFGAWALVWQQLVMQGVAMLLAWKAARWIPGFRFSPGLARSMGAFGSRVSAADVLQAAKEWAEVAIVASALGPTALGYLSVARRFVWVVTELTTSALRPISVVAFSRIRESPDRLQSGYLRALSLSYTVVGPLLTMVVVTAPMLVPLLFGDQWETSVPLTQILAAAAILALGATLDQGLLFGMGQPGLWLRYVVVAHVLAVGVAAVAVQGGLILVAWGLLAVALVATVGRWFIVGRLIACPVKTVSRPMFHMMATTTLSGGLGFLGLAVLPSGWPVLVQLAVIGVVVVVSSLAIVRIFQRDILIYALGTLPLPHAIARRVRGVLLLREPTP
jgi:O-antigen/teichoic acid export membrane protein